MVLIFACKFTKENAKRISWKALEAKLSGKKIKTNFGDLLR